jgi:hypothetical protein
MWKFPKALQRWRLAQPDQALASHSSGPSAQMPCLPVRSLYSASRLLLLRPLMHADAVVPTWQRGSLAPFWHAGTAEFGLL